MRTSIFYSLPLAAAALVVACSSDNVVGTDDGGVTNDAAASDGAVADATSGDGSQATDSSMGDSASSAEGSTGDGAASSDGQGPQDGGGSQDVVDELPLTIDGGDCNALVNTGPAVPETQVAADAPANGQGGFIALGLYHLTGWTVYTHAGGATGPTGNTRKTRFEFGSSVYYKVTGDNGGADEHDSRTWSTQSTTLNSNQVCPTVDNLSSDYTATPTTLTLIAGDVVLTFAHE